MIRVYNGDLEQALTVFKEKSKDKLKEAARHSYYSPDPRRKHHRGKTNSKNNQRNRKRC